jgi:hypothetical protein
MDDELRRSVQFEDQSDLMAAAFNFGEASRLMREANAIRARKFGQGLDPNRLRALTAEALGA